MKHQIIAALLIAAIGATPVPPKEKPVLHVAVVASMLAAGLWQEVAKHFEAASGYSVEVTATGNRRLLDIAFRNGGADVVIMHADDDAGDLVADGYAAGMTPWARNELVIFGPVDDPAGIRGMTNGAAALHKIAKAGAHFVDFNDNGSRQVADRLWKKIGIRPQGDWVIKDESERHRAIAFARKQNAYIIIGRLPATENNDDIEGMEMMVRGDPEMRRPFVVMVANANRFPRANIAGAQALVEYLTSLKCQRLVRDFAAKQPPDVPLFYPISEE